MRIRIFTFTTSTSARYLFSIHPDHASCRIILQHGTTELRVSGAPGDEQDNYGRH